MGRPILGGRGSLWGFAVKKYVVAAVSALALVSAASGASAALVTFNGGPSTSFVDGSFSTNLSGYLPDGFYALGPHAAYNGYGQQGEYILFNKSVTLGSLAIGKCGYCYDAHPTSYTVDLFGAGSVLIGSQTVTASSTEETLTFNRPGVTKVEFTFQGGDQLYPDHKVAWYEVRDISYTLGVPEPAVWALMIGGFGLAGAALRRRKVASA